MTFGEKLQALRREKKASQEETAAAAGISRRAYIGYEQEGRYPRKRETYRRLADFLGCDVNYLFTEDERFVSEAASRYGARGRQQARQLVAEVSGLFAGGERADEDKDEMMRAIQEAYWIAKRKNRKYGPNSAEGD